MLLTHPCLVFLNVSKGCSSVVELRLHERKGETPQCFQEPLSIVLPRKIQLAPQPAYYQKTGFAKEALFTNRQT